MIDIYDLSVMEYGCGIEKSILFINESNYCCYAVYMFFDLAEGSMVVLYELMLEQQILGWISGNSQFRKCDDI